MSVLCALEFSEIASLQDEDPGLIIRLLTSQSVECM
jgi:hypothetical protein